MRVAPKPENEKERIIALRRYDVLDTAFENSFDSVTQLACYTCKTPISAISLVDEDRQWFKAITGLQVRETPRDVAFCSHAILQEDPLIVCDATKDERFFDNPLVTSFPDIKFYAGIPLVTSDGYRLGTLCVIDTVPRELDEGQVGALKTLASQTMIQLEMRRSVKALRLSELVFQTTSDGMVVTNENNEIVAINPAFSKISGYIIDDIAGKNPNVLSSGRQDKIFYKAMWDQIVNAGRWDGEIWNRKKNGVEYVEWLTINAIYNETGKISGYVGLFSDITGKKITEQELIAAKESAEEATKLKDKFISLVSHDLKNPLSSMQGLLKLLVEDRNIGSEKAGQMIAMALESSRNMQDIINDLLQLGRFKAGGLHPAYDDVNPHFIAVKATMALAPFATDKEIRIINDIPLAAMLSADESLLLEVFKNLLSNAIKFSHNGGTVRFYLSDKTTVAIEDFGTGIQPSVLPNIFSYEVKTSMPGTVGEGGTGLGLPLCMEIIRAHGGDIRISSEEGNGTTFYVVLPESKVR